MGFSMPTPSNNWGSGIGGFGMPNQFRAQPDIYRGGQMGPPNFQPQPGSGAGQPQPGSGLAMPQPQPQPAVNQPYMNFSRPGSAGSTLPTSGAMNRPQPVTGGPSITTQPIQFSNGRPMMGTGEATAPDPSQARMSADLSNPLPGGGSFAPQPNFQAPIRAAGIGQYMGNRMGGMGGMHPMMGGMMGGMHPMMGGMMGGMQGRMNPMMGGMGGMNPMMGGMHPMMRGMGGMNPMMRGMGRMSQPQPAMMGRMNPMMGGMMGGMHPMMGRMPPPQQRGGGFGGPMRGSRGMGGGLFPAWY